MGIFSDMLSSLRDCLGSSVCIEGVGATVAAVIVFCGSVFLLLTFIMGAKLAYLVTASVTLGFMLIMGLIWSTNELGPVGTLPEWELVSIEEEGEPLEGPSASEYPEGPWEEVPSDDQEMLTLATELQTEALDFLTARVDEGELPDDAQNNTADSESVRLLERDGEQYGGVTLTPPQGDEGTPIVAIMSYDPGDPLGQARLITFVTLLLLAGHLFFLSRAEASARRKRQENATT